MFESAVNTTSFYTDMAHIACQNINGDNWNGDVSFVSTMRALLMPRMKEDERITFVVRNERYSKDILEEHAVDTIMNAITPSESADTLVLTEFNRNTDEDNNAMLDFIEQHFEKERPVKRIEKVTHYFKKNFRCLCYVCPEVKQTFIFTERLDFRLYHYLQVGILAFLPWYFDKESGVTPLEMELIESLRMKKRDKYIECLEEIATLYDFRTEYTKKALKGLENRLEKSKLNQLRLDQERLNSNIHDYQQAISQLLVQMRDNDTLIFGLEYKIAQSEADGVESEIMNYFLHNKRLYLQSAEGSKFVFTVKDYLMFWDEELAKNMIDNPRSMAYNGGNEIRGPYTKEDMKALFEEIFLKQNFKIRICGTYRFDIEGMSVDAPAHYTYGYEFSDCMPNPHLNEYRCLGNYIGPISDFLRRNDYIGAIEQSVASCRSLNFADGAVMSAFFRNWYKLNGTHANIRCIELPNGEVVDPAGAVKYMHEQKGEEDVQDN